MEEFYKRNAIGNCFKKENIYLGTIIFYDDESLLKELKKRNIHYSELQLISFIRNRMVSNQVCDIFYKVDNGYKRFLDNGSEILLGDNSDGKGFIENIVSAFDYYKEDEIFETVINSEPMIVARTMKPLGKYVEDYNLETPKAKKTM